MYFEEEKKIFEINYEWLKSSGTLLWTLDYKDIIFFAYKIIDFWV